MNHEQIASAGITMGQRLRMAAVRVGEVVGFGGLLTAVAIEGGAALNVETAIVQEAEAGTGIPGVVISGGCNPRSNLPQLTIANNTAGRLDFKASINGGPFDFAGTVEPDDSLTGSATTGDSYVHSADQIAGAQDVEVIPSCEPTTTVEPTVPPTPTTSYVPPTTNTTNTTNNPNVPPTTNTTNNPNVPPTTGNPNIVVIPGGEQGSPVITTGGSTTTTLAKIAPKASGSELARTGNDTETALKVFGGLGLAGVALIVLGRRRKQQSAA